MLFISFGNGSAILLESLVFEHLVPIFPSLPFNLFRLLLPSIFICTSFPFTGYFFFDQSTASVIPQLWQPTSGVLMSNDLSETKPPEESASCIALSKNDSYVMSTSGGKVSLFNMMKFKVCYYPFPLVSSLLVMVFTFLCFLESLGWLFASIAALCDLCQTLSIGPRIVE